MLLVVTLKSLEELKKMRVAGLIVGEILDRLPEIIRPGVTTIELDRFAADIIKERDATPAFKGVIGGADIPPFPGVICASINEELVHGVPSKRILNEGDIISVDVGCKYMGFHGDAARTYAVGSVSEKAKRLMDTTEECLFAAIEVCKPGAMLFDIGAVVSEIATSRGYSVVEEYVGHGIGRGLHEGPQVPNYVPKFGFRNMALRKGMVLAIEPMVNEGVYRTFRPKGEWTVRTADRKLCAHFEHTVALLDEGAVVLTSRKPCILDGNN